MDTTDKQDSSGVSGGHFAGVGNFPSASLEQESVLQKSRLSFDLFLQSDPDHVLRSIVYIRTVQMYSNSSMSYISSVYHIALYMVYVPCEYYVNVQAKLHTVHVRERGLSTILSNPL